MLQVDNDPIILGTGNPLSAAPLTGQATPVSETRASYTIQTALKLESKLLGTLGNAVTVKAEANTSDNLAISVTGNALTILLANATGSKNTMTLIAALIASTPAANDIFNAIVITGATQMTAFTVYSLSGGVNGTTGRLGDVIFDTTMSEWKCKYVIGGCYYWGLTERDVFPAVNTKYVSHYDIGLNKVVYKYRYYANTLTTGATTVINIPFVQRMLYYWGTIFNSATTTLPVPYYINSALTQQGGWILTINMLNISYVLTHTAGVGKPLIIDFFFTEL